MSVLNPCWESVLGSASQICPSWRTLRASPSIVNHHVPSGEKVIGSLDNQTATARLGQFRVESKFIKVYLTCFGPGEVLISVDGVGKFPLPCNQSDIVPSENQFQVSDLKSYSVAIESAAGQRWAATLAMPKA